MPKLKLVKSFVHNLADSYLSTYNYLENDYACGWLCRSSKSCGIPKINMRIRENTVLPDFVSYKNILLESMRNLNDSFDSMLASQDLEPSFIPEVFFEFTFPETSSQYEVNLICNAYALDILGNKHHAKVIEKKY